MSWKPLLSVRVFTHSASLCKQWRRYPFFALPRITSCVTHLVWMGGKGHKALRTLRQRWAMCAEDFHTIRHKQYPMPVLMPMPDARMGLVLHCCLVTESVVKTANSAPQFMPKTVTSSRSKNCCFYWAWTEVPNLVCFCLDYPPCFFIFVLVMWLVFSQSELDLFQGLPENTLHTLPENT